MIEGGIRESEREREMRERRKKQRRKKADIEQRKRKRDNQKVRGGRKEGRVDKKATPKINSSLDTFSRTALQTNNTERRLRRDWLFVVGLLQGIQNIIRQCTI